MPISLKKQLEKGHEKKLMNLYNSFFDKALEGDTQSLKAFIDVSKELFTEEKENELSSILKKIKVGD